MHLLIFTAAWSNRIQYTSGSLPDINLTYLSVMEHYVKPKIKLLHGRYFLHSDHTKHDTVTDARFPSTGLREGSHATSARPCCIFLRLNPIHYTWVLLVNN